MTFVCFSANMDLQIIYLLHTINQSSDKIRFLHVFFINLSQLPATKKKICKNRASKQTSGISYFVTDLANLKKLSLINDLNTEKVCQVRKKNTFFTPKLS